MSRITLKIDKRKVSEGEYVTVSWECASPDMVTLTVVDGGKTLYQLGDSGSKVIKASGNSDRMVLTLRASIGGKTEEQSVNVKVKRQVLKAESVHRSPRSGRKKPAGFSGIKDSWSRYTAQTKTAWAYMPEAKKLAVTVMGLLMIAIILACISPKLLPWALVAIACYLGWVVIKK